MSRFWFRKHKSGPVWYPSSWEGWTVLLVYYGALIYSFVQLEATSNSLGETLMNFLPKLFILSALLISITYLKSEQKPLR